MGCEKGVLRCPCILFFSLILIKDTHIVLRPFFFFLSLFCWPLVKTSGFLFARGLHRPDSDSEQSLHL